MLKFKRISYNEVDTLKNMDLRLADVAELRASTGIKNAWVALKFSVQQSSEWTEVGYVPETGEIITVFGLGKSKQVNQERYIGVPWMMASPNLINYKKLLMSYSKKVIKEVMLGQFSLLANYVDSRNELHLSWLKRMGFILPEGLTARVNNVEFQYFYMEREKCVIQR